MFTKEQQAMFEELNKLKAENEALKAQVASGKKNPTLSFRVSTKKALSIYGLGRFPVTMYAGQWLRLLAVAKDIEQFIADNKIRLAMEKPANQITTQHTTEDEVA